MFNTSEIELSKKALQNNIRFIKSRLKKNVKICSVIKGNAYGHGFKQFVALALECGIDYFAVHSAEEASEIKKHHQNKEFNIFIMGDAEKEALEWSVENNIEISVYDFHRLEKILMLAEKMKKKVSVHLEIETGMRRTGFEPSSYSKLTDIFLENSDKLNLQGMFTHLAGAESLANNFRVTKQIFNFQQARFFFENMKLQPVYHHAACSAVMLNYPEAVGNMVRIGILQYGFWPNKETHIRFFGDKERNTDPLKRIIKWKTRVMAIKEVAKGSFIGYGTTYLAHHNMKLAVIPVGYSHGYGRNLSNLGAVLINGKFAPVAGIVNMNSITVDISHIPDVEKGHEVVLIGKQNSKEITVNSFSEQLNQLNYEMLTRLPASIPRIIAE
jgi:alanine racemase